MITIKIQAGPGNQMFQYVLAKAIKIKTKKDITLDLSFYNNGVVKGDTHRGFVLNDFNTHPEKEFKLSYDPTPKKVLLLEKIMRRICRESSLGFYKKYLNPRDGSYLIGFWQNEKYFRDIIDIVKNDFTLKNKIEYQNNTEAKKYLDLINSSLNSVSIYVRREDYLLNKHANREHGLLSIDYYRDAYIRLIKEIGNGELDVFVFASSGADIDWCVDNFDFIPREHNVHFVPFNIKAAEYIYLISKCKYNIISNSTFTWWGAWLNSNPDKIVIAPKRWMRSSMNRYDVCPPEWIKIDNKFY